MDHPRLRAFFIEPSATSCPDEGEDFLVVLFDKDEKLRSHAVSHFMNRYEQEDWEAILGYSIRTLLAECEQSLRELGCPFISLKTQEAPCLQGATPCRLYSSCSVLIEKVMDAYLQAVGQVIEDAGQKPRYARFRGGKGECFCWMLPDAPIVAKLIWMQRKGCFNLMTCYRPCQGGNLSGREVLDLMLRRIRTEKIGAVEWCTRETWGLMEETTGNTAKTREKKSPPRRKRHYADGQQNWRRYLDEAQYQSFEDD